MYTDHRWCTLLHLCLVKVVVYFKITARDETRVFYTVYSVILVFLGLPALTPRFCPGKGTVKLMLLFQIEYYQLVFYLFCFVDTRSFFPLSSFIVPR